LPAVCWGLMPTPSAAQQACMSVRQRDSAEWKGQPPATHFAQDGATKHVSLSSRITVGDDGACCRRHLELHLGINSRINAEMHEEKGSQKPREGPCLRCRRQDARQYRNHLTSSAANFSTAVKGASSGTLNTRKGSLGSLVRICRAGTVLPFGQLTNAH
jgi:hypothetical protein